MAFNFILDPTFNGHPVVTVKTSLLMRLIEDQFDYYTKPGGEVFFKNRDSLLSADHAENKMNFRYSRVYNQIALSRETHMPLIWVSEGCVKLADGRNRTAALLAHGIEETQVVLEGVGSYWGRDNDVIRNEFVRFLTKYC